MNWDAFAATVPEIAERAESRFRKDGLCLVGTLRKDGSPRISPCELDFAAGELFLGMMWRSRKALDLLRDPHMVVHIALDIESAGYIVFGDERLVLAWNPSSGLRRHTVAETT